MDKKNWALNFYGPVQMPNCNSLIAGSDDDKTSRCVRNMHEACMCIFHDLENQDTEPILLGNVTDKGMWTGHDFRRLATFVQIMVINWYVNGVTMGESKWLGQFTHKCGRLGAYKQATM